MTKVRNWIKELLSKAPAVALIIALVIVMSILKEPFLSITNLMNILRQASINCFVAFGVLVVMAAGNMDISIGTNLALASCVIGSMVKYLGITNVPVLLLAGMASGILCGAINGILFTKLRIPSAFIVTLAMQMVYRGVVQIITEATTIAAVSLPRAIPWLGSATIFGRFPVSFIFVVIVCMILDIIMRKTTLGRTFYFVGGNKEAARLSGINVDRVIIFSYMFAGFMAGLGGITMIGRINSCYPLAGETLNMNAMTAAIMGGAAFNGGKGTMWGAFSGALLMALVVNALNLFGAQSYTQDIALGAVLLFAVSVDMARGRKEEKARRIAQANADLESISA